MSTDPLRDALLALTRATHNTAAQYRRFKDIEPAVYFVHPDAMRRIEAAWRAATALLEPTRGRATTEVNRPT